MSLRSLETFFLSRFTADEFRRFLLTAAPEVVTALPTGSPSIADLMHHGVAALARHGLISGRLFDELVRARPKLSHEIRLLEAVFRLLDGHPSLQVVAPLLTPSDREEDVTILARLLRADGFAEADALELAEDLLGAFPAAVEVDLGGRHSALLISEGARTRAQWPPLTVDARIRGETGSAIPVDTLGPISLRPNQVIEVEIFARVDLEVAVIDVTHRPGEEPTRELLSPEIAADGGRWTAQLSVDDAWGIEQFLFHVRPRLRELGARVAPLHASASREPRRPFAEEQARVLAERGPGWLVQLLVDHTPAERLLF